MKIKIKTIAAILLMFGFTSFKPCFAQYTKLLDFAGAANGKNPYGSLISDGSFLYGMTETGGQTD